MSIESLALLDSAQTNTSSSGSKKRGLAEENGALGDFAAILAQMQPGAMGFQRAEISLAIPQQADPSGQSTPAAEPLERDRGRDRQALDGDGRSRDAEDSSDRRDASTASNDDGTRRGADTPARQSALIANGAVVGGDTAATAQASSTQTQAGVGQQTQNSGQASDQNRLAQATAKTTTDASTTVQDNAAANGAAADATRQAAAASMPEGVKVKTEIVQEQTGPTTGAALNAATAVAAQSQKTAAMTGDAGTDPSAGTDGLDGAGNPAAQLTAFASRSGQPQNQTGQGGGQNAQAQQQAQANAGAQPQDVAGQAQPTTQIAPAGFQAALSNVNAGGGGAGPAAQNGQQPVSTIGGESLTSTAAVTGQASNSAARAGTAAQQPARTQQPGTPADQVAVQINRAIGQGNDKISIQLSPEELGRIDVKLEMKDGKMTALISAERPETLDMLKQDARSLLQSLQNAGLQTDSGSLSFNLRGGDAQAQNQGGQPGHSGWQGNRAPDGLDERPTMPQFTPPQDLARAGSNGRLDVRV